MDKIILVGNPNTGKTTLFNGLTNSLEHTGNWHGVTVDSKQKNYTFNSKQIDVIDLPGIYSLSPLSFEEKVGVEFLLKNDDYLIVNILDVNNLYRNFYLTLELIELGKPMIIVINKTCSENKKIYRVNIQKLEEELGVEVVEIDAKNKKDIQKLKQKIDNYKLNQNAKINKNLLKNNQKIENLMQKTQKKINFSKFKDNNLNFICKKCLQNDNQVIKKLKLENSQLNRLKEFQKEITIEEFFENDYKKINNIFKVCNIKKIDKVYGKSFFDKIFLNKFLAFPILFLTLIIVFYLTFFSVGKFFSGVFSNLIQNVFGEGLLSLVENITSNKIIYDFFQSAILGGIGTIFSFLPQVVILFVCLGILEDSGYMSRLAFMLDGVFAKVGLSGKSVYTLLMGFGCSTISCMSCRTMDDKNSQIKTAMLAPYMSCSAKLPIYTVIGSAFFGANNVFVIFAMYMLGVVVALILSVFYEKNFLKTKKASFIFELPPYKMLSIKRILQIVYINSKQFVVRVGSLLVSINIIVWIISNFSFTLKYVGDGTGGSIMQVIGKIFAPIFAPLGFGSWGPVSALFTGLVAKEIVVSSIAMFNGVDIGGSYNASISRSLINPASVVFFTPASAISYMIFCLLYSPCMATISVLKKEIGKKWTIISVLVQFVLAYLVSFISYTLVNIVLNKGILFLFIYGFVVALVIFSVFYLLKLCKGKNGCSYCKRWWR